MDTYIDALETQRLHAAARLRDIVQKAEDEKRSLTPEEQKSLEEANAGYDKAAAEMTQMRAYREKVDAADEARGQISAAIRAESGKAPADRDVNAWFLRAMQDVYAGKTTEAGANVERTIPVGYEARALSIGSQGAGTTVSTTIADFVAVYERTMNPMMDVSRVISTRTGAPLVIPRITADNTAGGSVTAEAGGITEGDPTWNRIQLTAFKIASTVLFAYEFEQDAEVNGLDDLLASEIARPVAIGWGSFFTLGTGTTQPQGFLPASTNGGTALGTANGQATDKYWSATDLITLFYTLAAPYRRNGSWMTASVNKMRSFKDSTGQFIWTPGNLALGQPDTFLGRPVYENPSMAAAGSANTSIAFGDFSKYIVRDVQPVRIDISRDYKFATDQLALRYITRRDGNLSDTVAIQYLVSQAI